MSLSAKQKRAITADWQRLFPALVASSPLYLVKRNGPVMCGLQLDLTNQPGRYVPTAFMHDLAIPFPIISMNCPAPYMNAHGFKEAISLEQHPSKMAQAAAQLTQQLPWLARAELSASDVLDHATGYLEGKFGQIIPFQTGPMELAVAAVACAEGAPRATQLLEHYLADMGTWPARAFNIIGSIDAWREKMLPLVQQPSQGMATAAIEAVKHKVDRLPDHGLSPS